MDDHPIAFPSARDRAPSANLMFELPLQLPQKASRTIIRDLHRQLRSAVLNGRLPSGFRLPSTRDFAARYGVSRNTAVAVYDLLLSEGYLSTRPRTGSYVSALTNRTRRGRETIQVHNADRLASPWRSSAPWVQPQQAIAYDFRLGVPDVSRFPWDTWTRLHKRALRSFSRDPAGYDAPAGIVELRSAIAGHVAHTRAVSCEPDDIIVTAGAQQAFNLLAQVLVKPDETLVAIEDPGYSFLRRVFEISAKVRKVPVDELGILAGELPLEANVICVTPSHQFPTGVAMTYERRQELLAFARQRRAVIIEDDYDAEFRYTGRPLDALQTLDRDHCVFYVGTFSKSMFPALRLGFIVAPPWARPAVVAAKQLADWQSPPVPQLALASFISEGHLARHIRTMRGVYGERRQALLNGIKETGALRVLPSAAGLHVGAEVADSISIEEFLNKARESDVAIDGWHSVGQQRRAGLSFGYGQIEVAKIAKALRLISGFLN